MCRDLLPHRSLKEIRKDGDQTDLLTMGQVDCPQDSHGLVGGGNERSLA